MSIKRILCPKHEENTPSCIIYPDGYFKCFGCGAYGKVEELNMPSLKLPKPKPPEDLHATIKKIKSLPTKQIRGLFLPYDLSGYYILYPTNDYYIKRLFNDTGDNSKYVSPNGHPKPLYKLPNSGSVLCIVEGQLNAMSLYAASIDGITIVSPGSAVDLAKERFMDYYTQFNDIVIFPDFDQAGVHFGAKLQKLLVKEGKNVLLYPLEDDFNHIHQNQGLDEVKKVAQKALSMLRVQRSG